MTFEFLGVISGHENEVKSAAFSPSGDYLATCSRDKSVCVYYTEVEDFEYEIIALLREAHSQDVKMVRWHPSQDVLFSCSYDDTVKIWSPDGDDWACKETLPGHDSTVWALAFDPVGALFATCSDDRTLRVWAPLGNNAATAMASEEVKASRSTLPRSSSIVEATYVSRLFRGGSLPTAEPEATSSAAAVWQPPKDADCQWRIISTIKGEHPRPVYSVDWLPFDVAESTASIASACGDNHVRVFQPKDKSSMESWICAADVEAHASDVNCVAWCPKPLPDGAALLASAGDDNEVVLWRFGV